MPNHDRCHFCDRTPRACDCDIYFEHKAREAAEAEMPSELDLMSPEELDDLAREVEAAMMMSRGIRPY